MTHFNADEFLNLPPLERARKCKELAAEAERLAAMATGDFVDIYLGIAAEWRALAKEINVPTLLPLNGLDQEAAPSLCQPRA